MNRPSHALVLIVTLLLGSFSGLRAVGLNEARTSSGEVLSVAHETGMLSLTPEGESRAVVFEQLNKVPVFSTDGHRASLAKVQPGSHVTVFYTPSGNRWMVDKIVLLPEAESEKR